MSKVSKQEVRVLLSSLQQFMLKMPNNKAQNQALSLQKLIKKYDIEDEKQMVELHKNLQYKFNFLKLAYPNLVNQIKSDKEQERIMEQQQKEQFKKQQEEQLKQATSGLDLNDPVQKQEHIDLLKQFHQNDGAKPQKESAYTKSGTYIMENGKLVEGEAEKRETVDFSNWYAGNVDPEDLKRHKELLDRQHFGGPVWDGKKPNPSILSELAQGLGGFEPGKGEENPNLTKEKEEWFENVKR